MTRLICLYTAQPHLKNELSLSDIITLPGDQIRDNIDGIEIDLLDAARKIEWK